MNVTINKRGDTWLDNGILEIAEMLSNIKNYDDSCVDFQILPDRLEIEIKNREKLTDYFTREIQNQLNNHIFIKVDDKKGGEKIVIRDHMLLQYGTKVNGVNTVGERLFSSNESKAIVEAFFAQTISDKKKQTCVLCGEEYDSSVTSKLKSNNLKQAVHPLATKNSAISHIRTDVTKDGYEKNSNASNYTNICINCYIMGVMQSANAGTIYSIDVSKEKAYTFMPCINNLKEAFEFRNKYINGVLTSTKRYSNIKLPEGREVDFRGKYSMFLLFLEKIAEIEEAEKENSEEIGIFELLTLKEDIKKFKDWYQLETNTGKLKNPSVNTVKILDNVYELIFTEEIKPFIDIISNTWFNGDYDTSYARKEEMAEAFIDDDYHKFALSFRPSKGEGIRLKGEAFNKLDNLIYHWRWKQVALSAEAQKTIKAAGRMIAATSQYRKSLVYRLEKVRTKGELLNVLSEVSKGYYAVCEKMSADEKKYINPLALNELATIINDENLDKKQFLVIKDTLTINSFVSLSKNTKSEEDK